MKLIKPTIKGRFNFWLLTIWETPLQCCVIAPTSCQHLVPRVQKQQSLKFSWVRLELCLLYLVPQEVLELQVGIHRIWQNALKVKENWFWYSAYLPSFPLSFNFRLHLIIDLIPCQPFNSFLKVLKYVIQLFGYFQWIYWPIHPSCHSSRNRRFCCLSLYIQGQLVAGNSFSFQIKGYKFRTKSSVFVWAK